MGYLAPVISGRRRVALETEIELHLARVSILIARLDRDDGDVDLEDDDPAGGSVDDQGEDEPWNKEGVTLQLPRYGLNQARGPLNEEAAHRQWLADVARPIAASIVRDVRA